MIQEFTVKSFNNKKVMLESFANVSEVVETCQRRKITDSCFDDKTKGNYKGEFEGVENYQDALDLLQHGYQPIVERMKGDIKANLSGNGKRISFHNDVVGYAPIVPLALQGVPTSMQNSYMKPIKAKVVDVYYDMTVAWHVSSSDIIKAGIKLLSAILELEMQGFRFNLYSVQSYTDSKTADMMCVKVKSSNTPLDLKRISFPTAHTAFFRVIGFDWYSKCPKAKYRSGYGHALSYDFSQEEMTKGFSEMFDKKCVVFAAKEIIDKDVEYLKGVLKSGEKI